MQITGKDFGPVFVKAKSGMIVAADRPVSYMRGWELRRAVALAERWPGSSLSPMTSARSSTSSSSNDRA
jgi:hypothetical protein